MKRILKTMLFVIILAISAISCNKEELFVEEPVIVVDEEDPTNDEDTDVDENDENEVDATLPCDFTLENIESNSTVTINCIMDLGGQTVNLPANITIDYDGGDIINGTLNFGDGGLIDGSFLNPSLNLTGSSPQVKDPIFTFDPDRWGIIEGKVSDEIALKNKTILQDIIDKAPSIGISTFVLDKMDAYFKVGIYGTPKDLAEDAIHLPSNFTLEMSDDTYLRVQPNDLPFSILLALYEKNNVKISGGNLIGDRWDHDYKIISNGTVNRSSHEWPVLLQLSGVKNSVIDNVYMSDATGDAFVLGNPNEYRYNGSIFNENIIVKNCTMNESRRNNITVSDGDDCVIENCLVTKAGIGLQEKDASGNTTQYNSNGVLPRTGLDIEPFIGGDDPNNLVYYARVQRLLIKGCTFIGNANGSIIDYAGEDVEIRDNFSDAAISANHGWRTKFINNTLEAADNREGVAISTGYSEGSYEVKGNTISGFRVGIIANGESGVISENTITDFNVGIEPKRTSSYIFENNVINGTEGVGISAFQASGNMIFTNNRIEVNRSPMNWQLTNLDSESANNSVTFDNNQFIARETGYYVYVKESPNVTIKNNTLTKARLLVVDSPNFTETNNIEN
ncbi:right-handed parallel beta-helix repeat-containing protein [Flavivirga aquimarina]|uniref:Right-handed parallel beta-helix repeat-containing protein n=1 Tax=Flavivirga aquimarina TaxID=2027862 RepID=A0ABT8WDA3_9FLAO|nr:right-handed parallel beta-helix repeat-containing protein [Flavivirga aquimarina]MDO5971134.1 right-handed parallel beta-helix repeat-containing protein [Flavivirga aquimarina]